MNNLTQREIDILLTQYKDLDLSWYQSTRGPQMGATIKWFLGGMVFTLIRLVFGIELSSEWMNLLVDAGSIAVVGIGMLWGYYKGRRQLLGQIAALRTQTGTGSTGPKDTCKANGAGIN